MNRIRRTACILAGLTATVLAFSAAAPAAAAGRAGRQGSAGGRGGGTRPTASPADCTTGRLARPACPVDACTGPARPQPR